jgi:hypothetical protein
MPKKLPNFIHGAIYRSKSGLPDASASAHRFNCYMPARSDIPPDAYVADCWYATGSAGFIPVSMFPRFRSEKRTWAGSSTTKASRSDSSATSSS